MTPIAHGRLDDWLKSGHGFWRRYASRIVRGVALVGVPAAVVLGSGGIHTLGFWLEALFAIPLSLLTAWMLGITLVILAIPVLFIMEKLIPNKTNVIVERVMTVGFVVLAVFGYVVSAELDTSGIRLPATPWPNLGALIVIGVAGGTSYGLLGLANRLEPNKPSMLSLRATPIEEPDDEFWSDQPVLGWRSWTWREGRLQGVFSPWMTSQFTAVCSECVDPPGWSDRCGIYAVKDPADVHLFHTTAPIVGQVEMWGNVIEHERGYRASHAQITKVWVEDPSLAREVRNAYKDVMVTCGKPLRRKLADG